MGSVSTTAPRGEGAWVPFPGMAEEAERREGLACRPVARGAGKVVQIVGVLAAWEQLDSPHRASASTMGSLAPCPEWNGEGLLAERREPGAL